MKARRLLSFVLRGSKRKSLANNSTSPVKISIPADMESKTPETTFAVNDPGL